MARRKEAIEAPRYRPPQVRQLSLKEVKVAILPSVKGLVSEGERVSQVMEELGPDCVAVGVSPGEIEGLAQLVGQSEEEPEFFLSEYERIYAQGLAYLAAKQEDEVALPPPSFQSAVEQALQAEMPLEGLDLDEQAYTEAYLKHITRWQWLRQGMRLKKLKRRPWASTVPSEFAMEFDDALCSLPGYAALESAREREMARRLREVASERGQVLAIIELPRVGGVVELLTRSGE